MLRAWDDPLYLQLLDYASGDRLIAGRRHEEVRPKQTRGRLGGKHPLAQG
jgi:hypothetical protein